MTFFETLFLLILIGIGTGVGTFTAKFFGGEAGAVVGILAAVAGFYSLRIWGEASHRRHCRKMREQYTRIFRVLDLPKSAITPQNSEVRIGDLGWECGPIQKNNLIYLQAFDEKWKLVWWAGFRPEQIEYVGPKPLSQYDRFLPDKQEILKAPCPFPVQPRSVSENPAGSSNLQIDPIH